MKKQKSIIIRNKKLQNLRNFLRMVIALAADDEDERLTEKIRKLDHLGIYKNGKNRTPEEKKESRLLYEKKTVLNRFMNHSICICNMCNKRDKDMVFFPHFSEWFCIDCYNTHYEGWMESTRLGKEQADLLEKEK